MPSLEKFGNAINQYVRPETYPVAIKLVKKTEEIPNGIQTIQNQLGVSMALCQGWGKVRFNAESVAMLKEDISCPIALFTLGLAEPTEEWKEGSLYLNWYTPHEKAAKEFANAMYRLPKGKYLGVLMAPIHSCHFEPDLVILYCNPLCRKTTIPLIHSTEVLIKLQNFIVDSQNLFKTIYLLRFSLSP